jgi:TRAP-type mannitol/chloroaromatic compound transport system permease small subunit
MSDPSRAPGSEPHIVLDELIHHTELPQTRLSRVLDSIVKGVGDVVSWLWVVLVAVIVANVTARYVFGQGSIAFEEIQWHLYAVGWLIGLSYCIQNDSHIRIDILHERFAPRTKAWIDFIGILVFLLPYTAVVLIYAPSFIQYSITTGEISDAPGGLPYRWVIKSMMFVGYGFILIAAISRLTRAWAMISGAARRAPGQE